MNASTANINTGKPIKTNINVANILYMTFTQLCTCISIYKYGSNFNSIQL